MYAVNGKATLGDMPLGKLTGMDLQRLYKHLPERSRVECTESRNKPTRLSVKTVRSINRMISSALNCAVEQRLLPANSTRGCVLPKLERRELKILPSESLGTFFREVVEALLKTKNTYRNIAIGADTSKVLKSMKQTSEYVFPSPYGGPMSPDSILYMLQRLLKRAGVERICFHDLRHKAAVFSTRVVLRS